VKIAFLDHHLNNWHADTFLRLLRGPLASEEIEVVKAWESNPTGDDWCRKHNVPRAASAQEAVKGVDAIAVLAPDNIEDHLKLCAVALPTGKPTLIDKFLSPTLHDAREIVELARMHRTPIFSSSSLRWAVELEAIRPKLGAAPIADAFARGMGQWSGYGVHTLSIITGIMGHDIRRVIHTGTPQAATVTLDYAGGRRGVVDVRDAANGYDALVWSFAARVGDKYETATVKDFDGFYANLMRRAAGFFKTGTSPMPAEEALKIVAVLEGAEKSRAMGGIWVDV
jgi:predicted dehydrogenase